MGLIESKAKDLFEVGNLNLNSEICGKIPINQKYLSWHIRHYVPTRLDFFNYGTHFLNQTNLILH